MQHVALDPLAAVQQVAQRADGGVDLVEDAQGLFQGVAGAHLVGDRADAADAGGDVRHFAEVAAAQEGLEEPRRLVDLQPRLGPLARRGIPGAGPLRPRRGPARSRGWCAGSLAGLFELLIIITRLLERFEVSVERTQHAASIVRGREAQRQEAARPATSCWAAPWGRSTRSTPGCTPGTAPRSRPASPAPGTAGRGHQHAGQPLAACTPCTA